jgi:photosystem II stability/assembly factor-like uncharacterized protein
MLCFSFTLAPAQQYGWRVIARPTTQGLLCVDFKDTLRGWVGGSNGAIYKTTDGGNTWTPFAVAFQPAALSMYDSSTGWAAGNQGRIYRTTNGGITWFRQRDVFEEKYNGTAAQSVLRNVTSGYLHNQIDTALVVRTTTGGASWQEQRFDSIGQLLRVVFVDSLHGWINTGPNFILRTTTGGQSWQQLATPVSFDAVHFIDTLHGWGGWIDRFYGTRDGGRSWQFLYRINPPPPEDFYVGNLSFADSLNGWAFGSSSFDGGVIYRTTDGGFSWYRESYRLVLYGYGDAIMLDRFHGWAVAADGRVVAYGPVTSVVEKLPGVPKGFALRQNYPNPFNAQTIIEYELSQHCRARVTIHDLLGHTITVLGDQDQEPGVYRVQFDARNLASGTYFYTLETPSYQETKQLLLVK